MQTKRIAYTELFVFLAALVFFGAILFSDIHTDIQVHAEYIQSVANGSTMPPANFLYYLTVYSVALFSTDLTFLDLSSMIVLSLSLTAKFTVTKAVFVRCYRACFQANTSLDKTSILFSVVLLVAFSLPTKRYYLGQIPPNVWHNSTTIFVMPFALLLFWRSYRQLMQPTTAGIVAITLLCMLNVFAKPSFFFVFSLSYPLMLMKRFGLRRSFWRNLSPVLLGLVVAAVMYYLIYELSFSSLASYESGVAVRPLWVWSHFSSNIVLSIFCSLCFPIAYLGLNWRDLRTQLVIQYAVLAYLIAVLIFAVLTETGPREFHGNFFWQCVICSYILFLVCSVFFAERVNTSGMRDWRNVTILVAFVAHIMSGVLYVVRILYTKSYF